MYSHEVKEIWAFKKNKKQITFIYDTWIYTQAPYKTIKQILLK